MFLFIKNHGVCKEVSRKVSSWGVLVELENYLGMKVFIPEHVLSDNSRPLISNEEAIQVAEIMVSNDYESLYPKSTWDKRYRLIMNVITEGRPLEVAKNYSYLKNVSNLGKASFGEKKLLESVHELLKAELKISGKNMTGTYINKIIPRAIKGV